MGYYDVWWQSDSGIGFRGIRRRLKIWNSCIRDGDRPGSGKSDRIAGYHHKPLRLKTVFRIDLISICVWLFISLIKWPGSKNRCLSSFRLRIHKETPPIHSLDIYWVPEPVLNAGAYARISQGLPFVSTLPMEASKSRIILLGFKKYDEQHCSGGSYLGSRERSQTGAYLK